MGTRLVGNNTSGRIVNGGRYTVTAIGEDKVAMQDDMTQDACEVPLDLVGKTCLLAHAMVYNEVQGATEKGTVMLHDMGSRYLRRSHLYVGLSPVTGGSNVFIARD